MTPTQRTAINAIPKLSRSDEADLIRRYQRTGCRVSRDTVINAHLKMVDNVVKRVCKTKNPETRADLWQEGCIGLLRAIEKFDLKFGIRFGHYAAYWVAHYARDYHIRNWCDGVKVPGFHHVSFGKTVAADRMNEPVKGASKKNSDKMLWALNRGRALSMDRPVPMLTNRPGVPVTMHDTIQSNDPANDIERACYMSELGALLGDALSDLPENQSAMIRDIYWRDLTTAEVGKRRGVSRQAVDQLKRRVIDDLRTNKKLKEAVGC